MIRALGLYRRLILIQIRSQLQYRTAFVMETTATALMQGLFFLSIYLVMSRFGDIGGWSVGEVAFLYGLVELSFGLMDMIFSGFDPKDFGQQVRLGTFDQLMLRPVDLKLQVFGSEFVIRRIGRIFQGLLIFLVALSLLDIQWTIIKILFVPTIILSLVLFFGGLFIIGSTITFWTVESIEAINILTYGGSEMMAYPMHIYQDWLRQIFTFLVPAIFLNYYPAVYILDKPDPLNFPSFAPFLSPVAGLGVFIAALLFWQFGLKYYQSTGS
ncbi:MAG: ABC-2 family transporter protein [Chloroflexota bacterium]